MNNTVELNNLVNVCKDDTGKITRSSPIVEVFSALSAGRQSKNNGKVVDKSVAYLKEAAGKANYGDPMARCEINTIVKYAIEPRLTELVKLYDFVGSVKKIPYDQLPIMKTWDYENMDARWQAPSADVPFGTVVWSEYPISTRSISSGFAIDYRELENGNFDGTTAEGMQQTQIDMQNKISYYIMRSLYEAIRDATGVKHIAETSGVAQSSVDDMLAVMRRYGGGSSAVNICGDYSVVSQLNDFVGYQTFPTNTIPFGSEIIADEIRNTGLITRYKGAYVTELPNAINWHSIVTNSNGDKEYDLYLPQGLLFVLPVGVYSPLQIFQRGELTSMAADDIVTRMHVERFDLEMGVGVAKGREDFIGLIRDTNFDLVFDKK